MKKTVLLFIRSKVKHVLIEKVRLFKKYNEARNLVKIRK